MSNNTDMSYRSQGQFDARLDVVLDGLRVAIFYAKYSVKTEGVELIPQSDIDDLEYMQTKLKEIQDRSFDHFLDQED
ncbi:hypothetical protein [Turicimonas muris]|uniref:hypothetical protein n=1 Tax=Turicimonas muris TaxID=1796652 RepID=UPI00272A3FA6|nr:hypothetical protein [Turicimonas muris]